MHRLWRHRRRCVAKISSTPQQSSARNSIEIDSFGGMSSQNEHTRCRLDGIVQCAIASARITQTFNFTFFGAQHATSHTHTHATYARNRREKSQIKINKTGASLLNNRHSIPSRCFFSFCFAFFFFVVRVAHLAVERRHKCTTRK